MLIDVQGLCFSYGQTPVLRELSFSAPAGALIAVLGPNGVGKSTLFRCLLGLLRPQAGSIRLDGQALETLSRRQLARLAAYIPQSAAPTFEYTVRDTVLMGTTGSLGLLAQPGRAERDRAQAALEQLGIGALAERSVARISGGERQLVLLARALVQQARILLMDEPTANLDYGKQHRVMQQIAALTGEGYTVLLSTHNPEHALRYASHVLALKDGGLAAWGETDTTLDAALIESLYRFPVQLVAHETEQGSVRSCVPL